jgi:hypothetical protein
MPNRHRILVVDDDHGLREALTEQLSLYEEFEAIAAENGIITSRRWPVIQADAKIIFRGNPVEAKLFPAAL